MKTTTQQPKEVLHTQGDFTLMETGGILRPFIIMCGEKEIAHLPWGTKQNLPETYEEVKANAELIVKAVNNHAVLVDALERALSWFYVNSKRDKKIYANGVRPSCIPYIETALNNTK